MGRRVAPLGRNEVIALGAASIALWAGGFLPCFSSYAGQVAENSYAVHQPLKPRLNEECWDDVYQARHRARELQDWPSRYNAIAVVHAEMDLDENVRIRLGILRNSIDSREARAFEILALVGLLPSFVYGAVVGAWSAARQFWRGHPAVDATMVSAGLFLGLSDSLLLLALRRVRGGLYVSPTWILFLIVPAIGLAAVSYRCARRHGYRRAFLAAAVLLAAFWWLERAWALEAGALPE